MTSQKPVIEQVIEKVVDEAEVERIK